MQLAIDAAGFTANEADELRRSMAAWERRGSLQPFREKLLSGMRARGYSEEFAERIFRQIQGFGEYGFPESHSASFALLAYDSAWIKCHHQAIFTAALLNSQPMGFYAPAQLIQDARDHGVEVRPVSALKSEYDCTLERTAGDEPALRLGLQLVKGLSEAGAKRLVAARLECSMTQGSGQMRWRVSDMARRARLDRRDLAALAAAGALAEMAGGRRQAAWQVAGLEAALPLLSEIPSHEEGVPMLRPATEAQNVRMDYASLGFTLGRHPMCFLRVRLQARKVLSAEQVQRAARHGSCVRVAGLVIGRQRPGTATGVTFVTLEDETGCLNLIVRRSLAERDPKTFLEAQLLEIRGRVQRWAAPHPDPDGRLRVVIHILAETLVDRSCWLGPLQVHSRDFH